jgi:predicted TIM-barrel fold metal-dependent hydrolase
MRIFSSAENCRRVARRISFTTCSAGSFTGPDFCPIFAPSIGYDGPKILFISTQPICLIGTDAGQAAVHRPRLEVADISHRHGADWRRANAGHVSLEQLRAYNDWILEYCSVAPDRLYGVSCIPTYDIDHGVAELRRCRKAGLPGALVWQAPPPELSFATNHYERLWAAAQDLEVPISLHILTGQPFPWPRPMATGGRRHAFETMRSAVNSKLLYASNAMSDLIMTGVLERYPRLKFVLVENEVSWIPFYLTQYDKYWGRGNLDSPLNMFPSEYFFRQFYATFFNDPPARWIFDAWGSNNLMWSNDYPHPNLTWPKSWDVITRDLGHLSEETRSRLLRENVRQLYKLPALTPVAV